LERENLTGNLWHSDRIAPCQNLSITSSMILPLNSVAVIISDKQGFGFQAPRFGR
jgi:hypothetical protein